MEHSDIQSSELAALIARLKRRDYGLYLSWRLSPLAARVHLTWLYGFYMDVTQIPYKVDEPMLGEIRLQWWRDQLVRARRGDRVGHPVADGLGAVFESVSLFVPPSGGDELLSVCQGIIESLLFEVQRGTISDRAALYDILDKRHGGLLRAALIICGENPADYEFKCREAGIAIGLTQMVASLPQILERGIMPLPQDILLKYKLGHEDFTKPEPNEMHGKVLQALFDENIIEDKVVNEKTVVISWDIKKRFSGLKGTARQIFSRWLLVPALLGKAMGDRKAGRMVVSSVNPLKIFFTLWRASF